MVMIRMCMRQKDIRYVKTIGTYPLKKRLGCREETRINEHIAVLSVYNIDRSRRIAGELGKVVDTSDAYIIICLVSH